MLHDVLDVGPPPASVVAQPPCGLTAGPPPTTVLYLHGTRRVEPARSKRACTEAASVWSFGRIRAYGRGPLTTAARPKRLSDVFPTP